MAKITFGDRLRSIREQRGMTQVELALAIGSRQENITKYETGLTDLPRRQVNMKLAEVLDVSPGWLAFGHEELDELPEKAIRIAVDWNNLTEEQKELIAQLIKSYQKARPEED